MNQSVTNEKTTSKPGFGHWMLHIRKTLRLMGALLRDPRVGWFRKLLFVGAIILFGVVLLIPDSIIATVALPLVGLIFGLPAGLVDIAALATLAYGLLNFFPKAIVREQTARLYGPSPDLKPHVK